MLTFSNFMTYELNFVFIDHCVYYSVTKIAVIDTSIFEFSEGNSQYCTL